MSSAPGRTGRIRPDGLVRFSGAQNGRYVQEFGYAVRNHRGIENANARRRRLGSRAAFDNVEDLVDHKTEGMALIFQHQNLEGGAGRQRKNVVGAVIGTLHVAPFLERMADADEGKNLS